MRITSLNVLNSYQAEIKMLDKFIEKAESRKPQEGTASYVNLQQMKKRREALLTAKNLSI